LDYDSSTGIFTWRPRESKGWNKRFAGKVTGYERSDGYISVRIDKKNHLAHRVAWIYVYGYMPLEVDHRDHNRANNAIANLREVDRRTNSKNGGLRSDNTSGHVGVSQIRSTGRWRAYYHKPGQKQILLGTFAKKNEAVAARLKASNDNDFHQNHGIARAC
jgi:hypothetical protein